MTARSHFPKIATSPTRQLSLRRRDATYRLELHSDVNRTCQIERTNVNSLARIRRCERVTQKWHENFLFLSSTAAACGTSIETPRKGAQCPSETIRNRRHQITKTAVPIGKKTLCVGWEGIDFPSAFPFLQVMGKRLYWAGSMRSSACALWRPRLRIPRIIFIMLPCNDLNRILNNARVGCDVRYRMILRRIDKSMKFWSRA